MQKKLLKRILITGSALLFLGVLGAGLFVQLGLYNVAATAQHTSIVYKFLTVVRDRSVTTRANDVAPDADDVDWATNGVYLYQKHCTQCHGAPGVAPNAFSLGLMPSPSSIALIGRKRSAEEIFWVIKNGIKMSGMPAWEFRLTEDELWQLTWASKKIHTLSVAEYRELTNNLPTPPRGVIADQLTENPEEGEKHSPDKTAMQHAIARGELAMQQYNCGSCHVIPNIASASNPLGPPLQGITRRAFIAGVLPYSDENLISWIKNPQQHDPDSAMPDVGVSQIHAEQMLAFLKAIDKN